MSTTLHVTIGNCPYCKANDWSTVKGHQLCRHCGYEALSSPKGVLALAVRGVLVGPTTAIKVWNLGDERIEVEVVDKNAAAQLLGGLIKALED